MAWTAPTASAPGGNINAPITTGNGQTKNGGLTINANGSSPLGLGVVGPIIFDTSAGGILSSFTGSAGGILTNGLLFDVNGKIGADEYCNGDGTICQSVPFGGGPGGSSMLPGWPDAISCKVTGDGDVDLKWIYYLDSNGSAVTAPAISGSASVLYTTQNGQAVGRYVAFNSDKSFNGESHTSQTDCFGKSITTLEAEGKTFYFTGPGGSADADWTIKGNGDIYNDTGNVGIGTTNPQEKLVVEGKIRSQSTVAGDVGRTVVTKDYVDNQSTYVIREGVFAKDFDANNCHKESGNGSVVNKSKSMCTVQVDCPNGYTTIGGTSYSQGSLESIGERINNSGVVCKSNTTRAEDSALHFNCQAICLKNVASIN